MKKQFSQKLIPVFAFLFLSSILFSCSQKDKPVLDLLGKPLEKQKINQHHSLTADSLSYYSYYIPESYNGKDRFPVLFFLDPHGDGTLPLKNYQKLADKYGYILIGSQTIKNGLSGSYSFSTFQMLLNESQSRFLIDSKRLFIAGFSGGAKLAIIFAQQLTQISGVIACGGSIPLSSDYQPTFHYIGIIGTADFNYLEAQQTYSLFDQKGIDYTSISFAGKHQWPPLVEFDLAFAGMELYCIKTDRAAKNQKMLDSLWKQMQDSIKNKESKQDLISQMLILRQTERWFNGIRNIDQLISQQTSLTQNPQFAYQVNKRQGLLQKEIMLRSEFIKAIDQKDLDWWNAEINRFKETSLNADKEVGFIGQRLLNYISMVSFMLTKNDLDDAKLDDAFKKIQIYERVDAQNPDVYLMYSRYYLLSGDKLKMVQSFNKALALGFISWEQYSNENSWKSLFSEAEIQQLNNKEK
jgi:predicted esterase